MMSVPATSNDDAEAEALRRAQRAHEPSMDEILASIRAIIAEDRDPPAPKPQIVYSSDAPVKSSAPQPAPEPAPALPTVVWTRKAEAAAPPAPMAEAAPLRPSAPLASPPLASPPEEPLVSQEAESAVAQSFAALSESLSEHAMQAAGEIAREMLRPMLKTWLDENLPAMVETLVRAEIQRLARGKR